MADRTFGTAISYGYDGNQPGQSEYARVSVHQPYPYIDALVEDVITNEFHNEHEVYGRNVGSVKIRRLPEDLNVSTDNLNWAVPLDTSIQEYPLIGEVVLVFRSMGGFAYSRKISITNKATENSLPGLSQLYDPRSKSDTNESIRLASLGISPHQPGAIKRSTALGTYFKENPVARPLRHFEGDLIIQGRFGNSIRFGSNQRSYPFAQIMEPNILMSVGQHIPNQTSTKGVDTQTSRVLEDINDNRSSIWMVADEIVEFNPATLSSHSDNKAHLRSTPSTISSWTGAQIFINSDRVVLNSKRNEVSIFSKTQINLSAISDISLDTEANLNLSANKKIRLSADGDIILKGNNVAIISQKDLSYKTYGNYSILGKKIFIGSGNDTSQPMVLGADLANFLRMMLTALITPGSVLTAVGPASFGPQVMLILKQLESALGSAASPQSAVFNSEDNFVSRNNLV